MAIYVTSDLHGLALKDFKALLKQVQFSDQDWLYILGDVIDRQNDGGIELLRWMMAQPNVQFILGNHEDMLLGCQFVFTEITDDNIDRLSQKEIDQLTNYIWNGGGPTFRSLRKLMKTNPETVTDILNYLKDAPLYETVHVNNRDFLLVHGGLDNFTPKKKISDYTRHDLIWAWPELTDRYYDHITTVFGHTPTMSYDAQYNGRILKTETWINVDVGVPYGNAPALLRLDDLEEIYLEQ